ncbi:hypothetical protein BC831DRAFT_449479 [Entophlyctis helioformis]|nr:hypothetical protein BC831DRAFT_449479 [Entophlyctis helioformis]
MAASVQSSIVRNVPSFALSTLVQPAVYVSLPMFIVLQAVFFFGAKRLWPDAFKTTAQTSWILTTMSSLVMTLASVPFLIDYFVHNTDLSAIELINAPSSVICSMYFVSYLIMDLALGNKYYPDQIDLITGWCAPPIIYPFFIAGVIVYQIPGAFLVASIMELPTIVLAIGHMNRSFRSEYLFGFLFFVTRLCKWRRSILTSDASRGALQYSTHSLHGARGSCGPTIRSPCCWPWARSRCISTGSTDGSSARSVSTVKAASWRAHMQMPRTMPMALLVVPMTTRRATWRQRAQR